MKWFLLNTIVKRLSVLGIMLMLVSSCQSALEQQGVMKQPNLRDLANTSKQAVLGEQSKYVLSHTQRSTKLAALYQNILTLEPDQEVRTQIAYRLVQMDAQAYEQQDLSVLPTQASQQSLQNLVLSYQALLTRFGNRAENEDIHYQLAKALSLQGKLAESLSQIELFLANYPNSNYAAELQFRRGDIYYNLQYYSKALAAYQAVVQAKDSDKYYVNSAYMSGWSLFKMNRLFQADKTFLSLLDYIVAQQKEPPEQAKFSFSELDSRYASLVDDIQRVLSVSLSQQYREKSLVALIKAHQKRHKGDTFLHLYRHTLFTNLYNFLLKNGLAHDAELTYQAYFKLDPNNIWAARFTLTLIDLYQQQGKHQAARQLKINYVQQYGLQSAFWQQGMAANSTTGVNSTLLIKEVLPNLLTFSYQHSRYLYAQAQSLAKGAARINAFANTAHWLGIYLSLAKHPQVIELATKLQLSQSVLADELLYADASFEAEHFQQALNSYEYIAYQAKAAPLATNIDQLKAIRKEAAYAATLTIRAMLAKHHQNEHSMAKTNTNGDANSEINSEDNSIEQALLLTKIRLDKAYVAQYPTDDKSLTLAVQLAQYAFTHNNNPMLQQYSNFILSAHGVITDTNSDRVNIRKANTIKHNAIAAQLNKKARKEVQIASQLQANYWYQQGQYRQAEAGYDLALNYMAINSDVWLEMRQLLGASIYFQAQQVVSSQPLQAVEHYLRLASKTPASDYRANALFDAANILFAEQQWQQAIDIFITFQQHYPNHQYSAAIPAKLAQSYENLQQWTLAAQQYLAIVALTKNKSSELQREALYTAAELFLKAGDLTNAISTFRTYAHSYPEPFNIAQEVRFKMSSFYVQTQEPNKEYYWYRKLIKYHQQKFNSSTPTANPRALYLASVAALALGKAHQRTFKQSKLTLPLNKSLARKKNAMKLAIGYFKQLLSFQLAEFVPQGTYQLAQMYRQLASDVLASQRPKNLNELALEEYQLLLEEIAYPFEEKAIEIHISNAQRAWQNVYDDWVKKSLAVLATLEPALYDRNVQHSKTVNKEYNVDAIVTLH